MRRSNALIEKMFSLVLFAALPAPLFLHSTTFTWNSTSSTDLNTAGNWTPGGGPPGAADNAVFDSTIPGIVTSPTASGAGFSVSTINFSHAANVFSLTINNSPFILNGGGIGTAILGSQTNATVTANNLNNSLGLANQILFNGNPSTSGSATLVASNSGTTLISTPSSAQISTMTGNQIYSPNPFTIQNGGVLSASNTGINQFNASFMSVAQTNSQLAFDSGFNGTNINEITLSASNSGSNSGSGESNAIAFVGTPQIISTGNFISGDYTSLTATNIGIDNSSGNGGNFVGAIDSTQVVFNQQFTSGDHTTITVSNNGTVTGNSLGDNFVGYTGNDQLVTAANFQTGDFLTLNVTQNGVDNSSGLNNVVGITSRQCFIGGSFITGNNATITFTNTGSMGGTAVYRLGTSLTPVARHR